MSYKPTESPDGTWYFRNRTWRRRAEDKRRYVTDTPKRFWNLTVADLPDTPAGDTVRWWCERWGAFPQSGLPLDDFENNRGRGLWLHGAPGLGKTRMASIVANHISDLGWTTKFITVPDYYDLTLQVMRIRDEEERDRQQSLLDCYDAGWDGWRLAVLDDFGKEHKTATGWAENRLDMLFRSRFNDAAPSVVTSNLTMDDVSEIYHESLYDFIHEAFFIVKVTGDSHRLPEEDD